MMIPRRAGRAVAPLPEPRCRRTVTRLPDGSLLLAAGEKQTTRRHPTSLPHE